MVRSFLLCQLVASAWIALPVRRITMPPAAIDNQPAAFVMRLDATSRAVGVLNTIRPALVVTQEVRDPGLLFALVADQVGQALPPG
jgi:hypothetical protein